MNEFDRAVLITGACGGIGAALCKMFKQDGYFVIATDYINKEVECDLFVNSDLEKIVEQASARKEFYSKIKGNLGGKSLKVLINNAAIQILNSLQELRIDDFRRTLDINVTAPVILSKLFLNDLQCSSGSIINIGSIHSKLTKKEFISYATSKAALLGLTQALAVDLGSKGVRVNIIQPAATRTEMLLGGFEGRNEQYRQLEDCHPLGRIADPDEVAFTALYLAGDNAKFISGTAINIDGAIGAKLHDPE